MIPFMRYRWLYLIISALVLGPGIFTLVTKGLRPAIDFTGGTLLELRTQNSIHSKSSGQELKTGEEEAKIFEIGRALSFEMATVQKTDQNSLILRMKPIDNQQKEQLMASISAVLGTTAEVRFETVGPVLGQELLRKTFIAALIAVIIILVYVAWAFKNIRYGVSAIVALVHDLLVVVSVFALLGAYKGIEVDALFVTAILTTMSFSVHDTIVVFDRIREFQKRGVGTTFYTQVNQALTETMGRSLNNSLTIIFMLLALFLMGGASVKWFALALLVGTISGTYSSPFVATPILYTWHQLRKN